MSARRRHWRVTRTHRDCPGSTRLYGWRAPHLAAYRKAAVLAVQRVREVAVPIDRNDPVRFRDVLEKCAATAMNSKLISHYQYVCIFAPAIKVAALTIQPATRCCGLS